METIQLECSNLYIVGRMVYEKIHVIDLTNKMIQLENLDTNKIIREPLEEFQKEYTVVEKVSDTNCAPIINEKHPIRNTDLTPETFKRLTHLGFSYWEDVAKWTEKKFQSNSTVSKKVYNETVAMFSVLGLHFSY